MFILDRIVDKCDDSCKPYGRTKFKWNVNTTL